VKQTESFVDGDLVWIDVRLPRLGAVTFGLILDGGRVVTAPPVARWTLGRPVEDVKAFYARHRATVVPERDFPSWTVPATGR
jgi:hypothetical protein